jgi:hypothetical protein
MPPSAEEFARWQEDRVTRWVFAAIMMGVEAQRAAWMQASWDNGAAAPELLRELRTRADAYMALIETPYPGWCEILGQEPIDG